MANWAIIVGIEEYQFLQSLMHSQNDAIELRKFLIEEAGFVPEQCLLFTNIAPSTEAEALPPTQQTLEKRLIEVCQDQVADGDLLWFFFSGYGVQADGKDYLMPIDGDPAQIEKTAIAIADVIDALSHTPTRNIVMALDINRSQGALPDQNIGAHTIDLAKSAEIPLLLSCEPDQFSHETLAVRHGLFTAAMLEGLRYQGCVTLGHLADYLKDRLPELCDHHWRPIQNPVAVFSDAQKFSLVVPQSVAAVLPNVDLEGLDSAQGGDLDSSMGFDSEGSSAGGESVFDEVAGLNEPLGDVEIGHEDIPELTTDSDDIVFELREDEEDISDVTTTVDVPESSEPARRVTNGKTGGALQSLGLLGLLLLLLAALLRNQPFMREALSQLSLPAWLDWLALDQDADQPNGQPPANGTPDPSTEPIGGDETTGTPDDTAPGSIGDTAEGDPPRTGQNGAPSTEDAATAAENTDTTDEEVTGETPTGEDTTDEDAATADGSSGPLDENATDGDIVSEPGAADGGGEGTESPRAASNTPPSGAGSGEGDAPQANAAVLDDARRLIQPNQAHQFAEAIAQARQISPGQRYYDEAQADIDRWSQVILDLSEGRASSGNLDGAIAAAQLVPRDRQALYQQAQQRIAFWQQRQRSRALIRAAQEIPRIGQSSSYQRGIIELQKVPANQPEYQTAQALIDDWSQKMLSIARARAAQGRVGDAIQAAELIPRGTAAHGQAQSDISRWQGE
ncbi:MAG: caspase family protein [Cyanobacteria bacterium J06635_1]